MKIKPLQISAHIILLLGVLLMVVPIWISFASSTHDTVTILTEGMKFNIGEQFSRNYNEVLNEKGGWSEEVTAAKMFINSFIMALGIATLKVTISAMSAYALVYYRFKLAVPIFWLIFITLLVPLEVRIFPTYKIVSDLGLTTTKFISPPLFSPTNLREMGRASAFRSVIALSVTMERNWRSPVLERDKEPASGSRFHG